MVKKYKQDSNSEHQKCVQYYLAFAVGKNNKIVYSSNLQFLLYSWQSYESNW